MMCKTLRLRDFYLERGKERERRISIREIAARIGHFYLSAPGNSPENHRPFSEKCVALGKMRHLCFLGRGSPRRNGLSFWSKEISHPPRLPPSRISRTDLWTCTGSNVEPRNFTSSCSSNSRRKYTSRGLPGR